MYLHTNYKSVSNNSVYGEVFEKVIFQHLFKLNYKNLLNYVLFMYYK